ncbi:MAG: hypothetical protein JST53_07575 [Actinobacteria bacterium]|nr:hypothetical protein [Actinomycetota bacterium]
MAGKKRIFVGFAIEDQAARNLMRGQSRLGHSPIEYTDFSVKEPWSAGWKTKCRSRLRQCDGMIALLSNNTRNAQGARWEIKAAIEEGIPVLGVFAGADRYKPPEIAGKPVVTWTWAGIGNWIDRL